LEVGSKASEEHRLAAENAFVAFLAFADRVNRVTGRYVERRTIDGLVPTVESYRLTRSIVAEAICYARETIAQLEVLSPRQPHEQRTLVLGRDYEPRMLGVPFEDVRAQFSQFGTA
jgi:hypothetical protein